MLNLKSRLSIPLFLMTLLFMASLPTLQARVPSITIQSNSPTVWYVDDDLQDCQYANFTKDYALLYAIGNASNGDIIYVYPGRYRMNKPSVSGISFSKTLTIVGVGKPNEIKVYSTFTDPYPFEIELLGGDDVTYTFLTNLTFMFF